MNEVGHYFPNRGSNMCITCLSKTICFLLFIVIFLAGNKYKNDLKKSMVSYSFNYESTTSFRYGERCQWKSDHGLKYFFVLHIVVLMKFCISFTKRIYFKDVPSLIGYEPYWFIVRGTNNFACVFKNDVTT